MWKHKTKWLVRGGRKVRCYLCGKKILATDDPFVFHQDTGYYSHQSCMTESTTISGNERRRAVKKIAVGAAVVGAIAAGAGKFLDVSSQSKNSPAAQTILTSQGLIPPALTSDPANPVPGQMWYRSDAGVMAHFDGVQNRVVYSSEINDGNVYVTSKGIVNGLSVLPNDGKGGFGPDTTLNATGPGQYGSPYTQSTGILNAYNYAFSQYIIDEITGEYQYPQVVILAGVFHITEPITITPPIVTVNGNTYTPGDFTMNGSSNAGGSIASYVYCETPGAYSITIDCGNFQGVNMGFNNIVFDFNPNVSGVYGAMTFSNGSVVSMSNINISNQGATQYSLNFAGSQIFLYNYENYGTPSSIAANTFIVCYGGFTQWFDRFSAPYVYAPTMNLEARSAGEIIVCSGIFFPNDVYGLYDIDTLVLTGRQSLLNQSYTTDIFGTIGETNNYVMYLQHNQNVTINTLILENFRIHNYETSIGETTLLGSDQSGYSITVNKIYYRGLSVSDITAEELIFNAFPLATPAVPASGTAQENTNPYPVDVYINGGDVTEIQITKNGTAYTAFSNSSGVAFSGQHFPLNPLDSITVTYSTAPTWEWVPGRQS